MKMLDMFNECNQGDFITSGDDVQYKIKDRVLYFQPSQSISDWEANFDFPVVPYKHIGEPFLVHRGFLRKWKSVKDEIAGLSFDGICGYSHGAALATLAHEDYWFRSGGIHLPTTVFGCPRLLWLPSESVRSRFEITRVKVQGDIVTNLPFAILGYRHVGTSVKVGPWAFPFITHHVPNEYQRYLKGE